MGDFSCPSKKPRLDHTNGSSVSNLGTNGTFNWEVAGNDDLWGQDELTAEEFDMLEVQATQLSDQRSKVLNEGQSGRTSFSNFSANCDNEMFELDRLKQEQYALEGKNKSLTEMLEKAKKELNDERSSREQIIDQKLTKFMQKETDLLKEIDKLQTALEFKEQEVRSERSRIHMIESKLKEKAKEVTSLQSHKNSSFHASSIKLTPAKKSPSKFPNWNSFNSRDPVHTVDSGIQTEFSRCRKFHLSLQAPRGEPRGNDAMCKLLSCRIIDPLCSSEGNTNTLSAVFRRARDSSSMSLAMLRCREELDCVWKPYVTALQEYVNCLRIKRTSSKLPAEQVLYISIKDVSDFDINCLRSGILPCLRDLTRLLFHQYPKETSRNLEELCSTKSEKKSDAEIYNAESMPLIGDSKMDVTENSGHRLPELLVMLANPTTYPDSYKKTYEVEWALAALVAWSSHFKESLESRIQDLPLHSLVSGQNGMECAYMAVKLMIPLIGLKGFKEALFHRSDFSCILCSTGSLCQCLHNHLTGNPSCLFMDMVENFLSGVLTSYGFEMIGKDSCPCSSQLVQGIIIMLLKQLQSSEKYNLPYHLTVMKKGIILLYFIATHLSNFRARRRPAEDSYVALICGLAKLSKENPELKKSQEMIRELWDFQDDSSEFETDEMHSSQFH